MTADRDVLGLDADTPYPIDILASLARKGLLVHAAELTVVKVILAHRVLQRRWRSDLGKFNGWRKQSESLLSGGITFADGDLRWTAEDFRFDEAVLDRHRVDAVAFEGR